MKKIRQEKGITLVALIITIIILLILATVTIMSITGDGIISKSRQAKVDYEKGKQEEEGLLAKFESMLSGEENSGGGTSGGENSEDNGSEGGNDNSSGDNSGDNSGNSNTPVNTISENEAYVGYYADVDGNGTVDGIIYADLAIGNTKDGQWTNNDGNYTINKVNNVKDYYISQKNYSGNFGTKDVLSATGNGNDRFYVMALEDFNPGTDYYWYYAAAGNMGDYSSATSGDFGTGKQNTLKMIEKWNNKAYGAQNDNGKYKDMWGEIQTKVNEGWFVPSRAEWSAFAEELGITIENYKSKNLSPWYWSSSQGDTNWRAWKVIFCNGYMLSIGVSGDSYVRLSTTF